MSDSTEPGDAGSCEKHHDIQLQGRGCGHVLITEISPKNQSPRQEESVSDDEGMMYASSGLDEENEMKALGREDVYENLDCRSREICRSFDREDVCEGRDVCGVVEDAMAGFQRGHQYNIPLEFSGDHTHGYRVRFRGEERTEVDVQEDGFTLRHERDNGVVVTFKRPPGEPQKPQETLHPHTISTSTSTTPVTSSSPTSTCVTAPTTAYQESTTSLSPPKDRKDIPQCPCQVVRGPQVPCCPRKYL